jgi:hypothetical protein
MTSADPARTPLVDVHAHFLTDHYVQAAKDAGHLHPDGGPGWPAWSAGQHLELMDQWGIAISILSISSPGAPHPDGDTWRALTTRNAQRLFPRLNEIS